MSEELESKKKSSPGATSGKASRWVVSGGTVRLRDATGSEITPTALEILSAEKKGLREIQGRRFVESPSVGGGGLRLSRFPVRPELVVTTPSETTRFSGGWHLRASGSKGEVELSAADIEAGHIVRDGMWYPLESGALGELRSIISANGLGSQTRLSIGQYLRLVVLVESGPVVLGEWREGTAPSAQIQESDGAGEFPGLVVSPYPYQGTGIGWLRELAKEELGGILGDEMGLGKTLQVIALFAAEISEGRGQHLVIAPVSLLENWLREIRKFAPSIKPLVHQGPHRTGFPRELKGHDLVLTSYDTVLRDEALFQMIEWGVVVLDEAQAIKNPEARRTDSVKSLIRRVGIAVTGTPVENRLRDLWSLMDFAMPGYLGSEAEFTASYEDSVFDAEALEPLVTPLMLRRRVAEVAKDLPERIDIPQVLTLSDWEAEEYERIRLATIEEYGVAAALVNLVRLRMFCTHPEISGAGGVANGESTKLTRLLEILEEVFLRGEKALVFTSFTEAADIVCRAVQRRFGVAAETLDGRRAIEDRQPLVDRFGSDPNLGCLVLNPKAAGTGLNITAANHVIHFNPEWNPATEDQSTARAYRRGQTRPVTVHRLIIAKTVEEAILDRLERKRELADVAVVGVEGNELKRQDIVRALEMSPITNSIGTNRV